NHVPERILGCADIIVLHQDYAFDPSLGKRKHQFAHTFWSQRIGRDTACLAIHRVACRERAIKSRSAGWLDSDDSHASLIPGCDAAKQSATSTGDQERIDLRRLFLHFQTHTTLADQRFDLIIGMYRHRTRLGGPLFTYEQRIVV